ncbi:zinc-dependent peptidase [Thiomicrospira microaerophila]|uniref:M90 family metallopeptidase n=1 Tax=Thiomicrospira microaerophila TaxID=406020 RepID=UPI00200BFCC0|nr:M90 family metallopeptidase [Thiomicrospira microaerophila]UQB43489.1 zinc-dependent peptidase [Thiomicrospira microaerophila]
MFWKGYKHWRIKQVLKHHPIARPIWRRLMQQDPIFQELSSVQKAYLRELVTLFINQKRFSSAQGLVLTESIKIKIAAHACLLILELDLDFYQGWRDIIVYPTSFVVERDEIDDSGVVLHQQQVLGGEAWLNGPVILDWQGFKQETKRFGSGRNLVIHEFAHKLDMLNGAANGRPPLHQTMSSAQWQVVFSQAFETLTYQIENQLSPCLNAYASTTPAEFFAVCTEYFFTAPDQLAKAFPAVYHQLSLFYRQDPQARQGSSVFQ